MSSTRFTPGPWAIEDPLGPEVLSIVHGGPESYHWRHIAEVPVSGDEDEGEVPASEAEANARLISAAPELYSEGRKAEHSLNHAADFLGSYGFIDLADDLRIQVRELAVVLAKARGERS
jgi:hypothetical protein